MHSDDQRDDRGRPAARTPGQPQGPSGRSPGWDKVATGLGWFSAALGAAQVAAPGRVNRLAGLPDTGTTRRLQRAVGVRELTAAGGLFSPMRPAGWMWARVAGDALDIALAASALGSGRADRRRVAATVAGLGGIAAADALVASRNGRASRPPEKQKQSATQVRTAITINKPVDVVYERWRAFENLPSFMYHLEDVKVLDERRSHWVAKAPLGRTIEWDAELTDDVPGERIAWRSLDGASVEHRGEVRFTPAPGNRGTEVVFSLEYRPPLGALGAAAAKLFGEEPEQQAKDDLRRFKQVLETGEVVRSEGTPEGTHVHAQWHQHDGRPAA